MKIAFSPINKTADVVAGTNLLEALLAAEIRVRTVCRGRGICATCQVKTRCNPAALSPRTPQELKTLSLIAGADGSSRLACQARILGDGITVELPQGLYVEGLDELLELVGDTAVADYLHPVNGSVLIQKDKLITRSRIQLFHNLAAEISSVQG